MYDYCHLKHTTKKLRRGQEKTEKQQNECRELHAHNLLLIQVASCNPVGPRRLVVEGLPKGDEEQNGIKRQGNEPLHHPLEAYS